MNSILPVTAYDVALLAALGIAWLPSSEEGPSSDIRMRWGSQTICLACGVGFVDTRISLVFRSNVSDQNKPIKEICWSCSAYFSWIDSKG